MRAITWDIVWDGASRITVSPLGDWHVGARACDEKALEAKVAWIASDPSRYWIGMGDYHDAVGRNNGDRRANEETLARWLHGENKIYDAQRKRVKEIVQPIAGRCLGLLLGNHESSAEQRNGIDMYYYLAEFIQDEAGHDMMLAIGYTGFIRLRFRRLNKDGSSGNKVGGARSAPYTIFAAHGYGGGRKSGGKALKLDDMVRYAQADAYLFAHVHAPEMNLQASQYVMRRDGRIVNVPYVAALTGTYLDGAIADTTTYPELAMYPPGLIGGPDIHIVPEKSVSVEWNVGLVAR